jgi:hypothetical protein
MTGMTKVLTETVQNFPGKKSKIKMTTFWATMLLVKGQDFVQAKNLKLR